ncbi:SAM-dependent methyltransferase [Cystobacter fuscus]|uniref:SAM-dependent methyltransferase n=1 Tax=Cystobacter fuscus TaxID=43 RepID=UPI0037BEE395
MYADSEDPWEYRRRWYERRKRALTLAMLPHARYARAFEPGCSIGELSAELAARCDALLVSDGSEAAVRVARRRLAPWPHVRVEQRLLPDAWPEGTFELVSLHRLERPLAAGVGGGDVVRVLRVAELVLDVDVGVGLPAVAEPLVIIPGRLPGSTGCSPATRSSPRRAPRRNPGR